MTATHPTEKSFFAKGIALLRISSEYTSNCFQLFTVKENSDKLKNKLNPK
jgi:hypothetical protein